MIDHIAVAFYPEHLREERWERDIRLMREFGIDTVRMLEFAWSRMEPADGEFDFAWVHRVMSLLQQADMRVIACTPTAAPPVWLTRHHQECLAMDTQGHRAAHGHRRQYCPTSRVYRSYSNRIAAVMQRELAVYANILLWHIDNEFGWNKCFCPECDAAFRLALKRQYGTLEALNEALGGAFWSVDFWDWDDVLLPRVGAPSPELQLAQRQFYSEQITSYMCEQVQALRDAGATAPISTNMMGDFDDIDYWHMADALDVVGFDNYFDIFTLAGDSLAHNLLRSLKGGIGYWTFENGVNSVGPWLQSAPGYNIVHAISALAHGEVGHTFYRWDSCRFGHEQDLQGLVDWGGEPRAKLHEVKALREALDTITPLTLPPVRTPIALAFSYPNYWTSGRYYRSYWEEAEHFYQALFDLGYICDCVRAGADLSRYALLLTPGLQIVSDDELAAYRAYVRDGGVLLSGRKTFCKTPGGSYRESRHPALEDVFGLRVVETQENLDSNDITVRGFFGAPPRISYSLAGTQGLPDTVSDGWFEVLAPESAETLYSYADGYFAGQPVACRNRFGQGQAYYLGTRLSRDAMREVMRRALAAAGITDTLPVPQGMQVVRRGEVWIATNHSQQTLTLPLPREMHTLAGAPLQGCELLLPSMGWSILKHD